MNTTNNNTGGQLFNRSPLDANNHSSYSKAAGQPKIDKMSAAAQQQKLKYHNRQQSLNQIITKAKAVANLSMISGTNIEGATAHSRQSAAKPGNVIGQAGYTNNSYVSFKTPSVQDLHGNTSVSIKQRIKTNG